MVRGMISNAPTRKPYQKPEICRVRLVAEEAVLAGCKQFINPSSPGPNRSICSHPAQGSCLEAGS